MKSADGRFEYLDLDYEPLPPGTAAAQVHRFGFRCPRGQGGTSMGEHAGMCTGLNLRGRGHDIEQRSWAWNGDVDRPTFSPSINCGHCRWHGYIEGGVLLRTDRTPEPNQ